MHKKTIKALAVRLWHMFTSGKMHHKGNNASLTSDYTTSKYEKMSCVKFQHNLVPVQ